MRTLRDTKIAMGWMRLDSTELGSVQSEQRSGKSRDRLGKQEHDRASQIAEESKRRTQHVVYTTPY
jgi:hypothetical protein